MVSSVWFRSCRRWRYHVRHVLLCQHCFAPGLVRVYLSAGALCLAHFGWSPRGKEEDGLTAWVEPPYCKSSNVVLEGVMPSQGTRFLSFFPQVIEFELGIWDFLSLGKGQASRSWIVRTQ